MLNKKYRRAFSLLSVVFLFAALVFLVTACSLGGSVEGGGSTAAPTMVGIEATVADGSTLNVQGDRIVMALGQISVIANGDLTVVALYSDGSRQPLTDFTVDASSLLSAESSGLYSVFVAYGQYSVSITVDVVDARASLPAIETVEIYSVEYSGEEIDVVAKLDENRADEDKIATLLEAGKVTVVDGEYYTRKATDAGDYQFCLRAADGYVWGDESTGFFTEQYVGWRIAKKVIPVPTAGETTSFVYTGSEITLPVDLHGFDDVVTLSNGGAPTNVATNANPGENVNLCIAYVRNEYRNNYVFEGNLDAVEVAQWKITPRLLPYPVLLTGTKVTENQTDYYHFDYNEGNPVDVRTNVDGTGLFLLEGVSYATYVSGGYFTVNVTLDETKANRENYRWEDGSEITGPVSFNVVVDPVDYTLPAAVSATTLYAETEYRPGGTYAYDDAWLELTSATRSYLTEQGIWIDGGVSQLIYNDDATFAVGTRTLKYLFRRSPNYNLTEIDLTVTVKPASVKVWGYSWQGRQNVDVENNWFDVREGNFIYNGRSQRKALNLAATSDYLNEEGLYPTVTYRVYYGTTEGVYGQEPVQTVTVTANERGEVVFDYIGVGSVNAGYYKTVATLSVEGGNYVFVMNGNEVTSVETEWQIEKAVLTVYPNLLGTFGAWAWNGYYSYFTGANKTVSLGSCSAVIETFFDDNGNKTVWGSYGGSGDDFDLADYVEIGALHTYFFDGDWQIAENTSAIGRYKTTLDVSLKDGADANFTLCVYAVGEDGNGIEWTILNNVIDASGMGWINAGSYVYRGGAPILTGVPAGLSVRYYDLYEDGFCGGNVGANRRRAIVWAEEQADGYEGVTLTLPDGWTYDKDNSSNPILQTGTGTTDYAVTKKIITLDDFYLLIDGERATAPYEFAYVPDHYYSSSLGMDGMAVYGLEVERNDWNSDGHGCYNNQNEIGTYEFGGFVYLVNNPMGNYGFDESQPYVRQLTEDYVYGEGENAFVISVTGDSHGSSNVMYINYAYVLDFSYVWSIVAPAD